MSNSYKVKNIKVEGEEVDRDLSFGYIDDYWVIIFYDKGMYYMDGTRKLVSCASVVTSLP